MVPYMQIGNAAFQATGPIIAGLIANALAAGDQKKVEDLKKKAVADYGPEILPELEKMTAEQQGPTELASMDPAGRNAQMRALQLLEQESQNGYTPEDAAAYAQASQEAGNVERGMRGANERRMAARGMSGSGLELAANLQGQQSAQQGAADAGLQTARDSRMRALKALESYGGMGSNIRQQDSRRAEAQDAINRFNVGLRQHATDYNANLPQQQYDNNMRRLGKQTEAQGGLADYYQGQADRTRGQVMAAEEGLARGSEAVSGGGGGGGGGGGFEDLMKMWGG